MKKKFLLSAFILLFAVVLSSCGSTNETQGSSDKTSALPEVQEEKPEENSEQTSNSKSYNKELYSGEWGIFTLKEVSADGLLFTVENTTKDKYTLYSDYMTIDGTEYEDDFETVGCVYEDIASGSTRDVLFQLNLDNTDISTLSGQFKICEFGTGYDLDIVNFENVDLE